MHENGMASRAGAFHPNGFERPQESQSNDMTSDVMSIAVIGMAFRGPGEATSVRKLWDMCCEGRSAWSEIPKDRISADGFWHPDSTRTGCFTNRGGHFLKEDISLFDAPFFHISPNEAMAMDPQQRLLLESTYEALENAGIPLQEIAGEKVGVYVGCCGSEYAALLCRDPETAPKYQTTGSAFSILANRVSYVFDLKGPSFTVDTACSSSLTAVHVACQSLRLGEIRQAIVGGTCALLSPDMMSGMSSLRLFSEEGRCFSFDCRGSGYGRGEGVASVILKPLQDAVRDHDNICGVIRNTGMNQDGKTRGIVFPNQQAQAELIKSVYDEAGLDPAETCYVEAHGTGTAVGDPVEAGAIAKAIAARRSGELIIGSVKSNVGHMEGASGLAGLIKTCLVLQNGKIPPSINFEKPNERIPLLKWNLKIPTSLQDWPAGLVRRASLSSFGFGGANLHVILEASPQATVPMTNGRLMNGDTTDMEPVQAMRLFIISAADKISAQQQITNLIEYVQVKDPEEQQSDFMANLAYTLGSRRSHFEWWTAFPARSTTTLLEALHSAELGPKRVLGKQVRIGFIFTGQGSQWYAMGRELIQDFPIFASVIREAEICLKGLGATWSLLDELYRESELSLLDRPHISQPATTAIQIGLVSLLRSWGVVPAKIVGHSSGEFAAAYATGGLSLRSCLSIAFHRGLLASTMAKNSPENLGAMLAIGASSARVEAMLKKTRCGKVSIACINSPSLVVASGDQTAILALQKLAETENLFARRLQVDVAYHSQHMDAIADEYLDALGEIVPSPGSKADFYSSLRGQQADQEHLDSMYWVEHMISPVKFSNAVEEMCLDFRTEAHDSTCVLIEIGPHSGLKTAVKDILKVNNWTKDVKYLPSLVKRKDASLAMLELASELFTMGQAIDFSTINFPHDSERPKLLADLPPYAWRHDRSYWHESRLSRNYRLRRFPRNDILGSLVDNYNDTEPRWRNVLRTTDLPWLLDHKIQSSTIFPFAGFIVMAVEAMRQWSILRSIDITESSRFDLREVLVSHSMVIPENSEIETSITLRALAEGTRSSSTKWNDFSISSWTQEQGWIEHCRGFICLVEAIASLTPKLNDVDGERCLLEQGVNLHRIIEEKERLCDTVVDCGKVYETLAKAGLEYGPSFRNVCEARAGPHLCVGLVNAPNTAEIMPCGHESESILHPALLDAYFHTIPIALLGGDLDSSSLYVPTFIKALSISHGIARASTNRYKCYATGKPDALGRQLSASLIVFDGNESSNIPVFELEGFIGVSLPKQDVGDQNLKRGLCYKVDWKPIPEEAEKLLKPMPPFREGEFRTGDLERAAFCLVRKYLDTQPNTSSFPDHYKNFYARLDRLVEIGRKGELPNQTQEWLECDANENEIFLDNLRSHGGDASAKTICRMGENLPLILSGAVDPKLLLNKDNLFEEYCLTSRFFREMCLTCTVYADILGHQNPHSRILELDAGVGMGNITMEVLKTLGDKPSEARFLRYDYTYCSENPFERAKERIQAWEDLVTFNELDILKDPTSQGFQDKSYDLILVSNILTIGDEAKQTLQNIRRLLKPRGRLIFAARSYYNLADILVFGMLSGSRLGSVLEHEDAHPRSGQPWLDLLEETGFSCQSGLQTDDNRGLRSSNVFVCTAASIQDKKIGPVTFIYDHYPGDEFVRSIHDSFQDLDGKPSFVPLDGAVVDRTNYVFLELDQPVLPNMDARRLQLLQSLFTNAAGIVWVSRGAKSQAANPESSMSSGWARCLRSEMAGVKLVNLDFDRQRILTHQETADVIYRLYKMAFTGPSSANVDMEYSEANGMLTIPRLLPDLLKDKCITRQITGPVPENQPYRQGRRNLKMIIDKPGILDAFSFVDTDTLSQPIKDSEVEIIIHATGMNFKDLMIGLGQIQYQDLGLECSGNITALGADARKAGLNVGDRVCAISSACYANFTRSHYDGVIKITDEMDFPTAASIPIVYCTAYHALFDVGRLNKGELILIHAAAGGVGQAAVMLAQHAGAEIYVTVGSLEKKGLMMDRYRIPEDHIFSSRETTFEQGILRATHNRGVNVVLNSLSGEGRRLSFNLLAPLGRFVEIGKRDVELNAHLEMNNFLKAVTFAAVDLGILAHECPPAIKKLLIAVFDLLKTNSEIVRPVTPITTFPISEVKMGLRKMQGGKHMGKIVIEASDDAQVLAMPAPEPPTARSDATYLITGGTGGLGRSLTRWLAKEGAKNIVLASRSGATTDNVRELIGEMENSGTRVVVQACDIIIESDVKELLDDVAAQGLPPIAGVIHGAMVLQDVLFEKSTFEAYTKVIQPRVRGTWNLHNALLATNTNLDFFVILASASGILGNPGQSAYAASNSFLDAFSHYRRNLGLPAASVDIGLVEGVGYVAEHLSKDAKLDAFVHDRINERELHALVKAAIANQNPDCDYRQTITGLKLIPGKPLPFWATEPKVSHILRNTATPKDPADDSGAASVRRALRNATSRETAIRIVCDAIVAKLSAISMTPAEQFDLHKNMDAYGLDSLMAVEVRNWMASELEVNLSLLEFMKIANLMQLGEVIVGKSRLLGHLAEGKEGREGEGG